DIFQLGNSSWQIQQIGPGIVRVSDAKGAPPNIPFWLGEAPARSDELSLAVSDLRGDVDRALRAAECAPEPSASEGTTDASAAGPAAAGVRARASASASAGAAAWLSAETGLSRDAADQAVEYLAESARVLGAIPTQDMLVLERFFDESG